MKKSYKPCFNFVLNSCNYYALMSTLNCFSSSVDSDLTRIISWNFSCLPQNYSGMELETSVTISGETNPAASNSTTLVVQGKTDCLATHPT